MNSGALRHWNIAPMNISPDELFLQGDGWLYLHHRRNPEANLADCKPVIY